MNRTTSTSGRSRSDTLTSYPYEIKLHYSNDQQYRECMRKVCQAQSCQLVVAGTEDIDDVTRDEWDFDQDAMTRLLDTVYLHTRAAPFFQRIYQIAAGKMLSEDPEIGLAVLFSYDYFALFHACLCDFFQAMAKNPQHVPGDMTLAMSVILQRLTATA